MRKSTLILSILLTAVVIGLLFMLVSTYQKTVAAVATDNGSQTQTQAEEQTQPQQEAQLTQNLADIPAAGTVRIYDAAAEAAKVLGRKDVYITEYSQLDGVDVYLVSFVSGDLVYVSLDGKVISTSKQDPIGVYQPTSHR